MDVLSDVLLAVRLSGALFYDVQARAPFVASSPSTEAVGRRLMVDAEHVIAFHVVTAGGCWVERIGEGGEPERVRAGDMVMFPGGDANYMASAPGMRGEPMWERYFRPIDEPLPMTISVNERGPGERCRFVCGYLACDTRPFNPLLASLPPMIRAPVSPQSWGWVTTLLDTAVEASAARGAGREATLAKLAELMFLEALRQHIEALPAEARGWVAGLRDRRVGDALRVIHARPAERWTIDRLAREIGMSRSSLADRFADFTGMPPMTYLTRWRLQLAARMLERGVMVTEAAAAVGYQSDAAFTRAFTRHVGTSPGAWRAGREGGP
ncbi:MAG: AraC family transcriptional regulator [Thermoleophilia bacterium]